MFSSVARMLSDQLIQNRIIQKSERDIYEFGFECWLADIVQIFLLATFAFNRELILETTAYALCFTSIKRHIGGWHANSHTACLFLSTLITVAAVLICCSVADTYKFLLFAIFLIGSVVLVAHLAPVTHYNNPKTESMTAKQRIISLVVLCIQVTLILTCIAMLPRYHNIALCGSCGLFLAAFTLIIPNRKGKNENE